MPARALIWLVFKRKRNLTVERADKVKKQALGARSVGSFRPERVNGNKSVSASNAAMRTD